MTADALEQVLVVQDHDTRATQLRTRRDNLAERAEAAQVAAADRELSTRLAAADAERHRIDREQSRIDDEIARLREKSEHTEQTLYSGNITNPRELQGMQEEMAALARRIDMLEESEIELMVEREPFDDEAETLGAQRAELAERIEDLARRITAAEAEIDVELEAVVAARSEAAALVPDELLAEYEKLRAANGGVGAARLEHGTTCGGCHMKLPAMEYDRIKNLPPDARIYCEDCGRILVR